MPTLTLKLAAPHDPARDQVLATALTRNTAAQKATFIEAAFAELQGRLAPGASLEEASYVIVREVPATDWGYGGMTQQARQALRQRPGP